jgi:hypothetical protein
MSVEQASQRRSAGVFLLGPQVDDGSHAGAVLRELGVTGPVALVTAGWQEREPEDAALTAALGVPTVNLRLHARSEELFATDKAFATAYKERQARLRHIQSFYRVRLENADDAARAIAVRHVAEDLIAEEWTASINLFRHIDGEHLERCRAIHRAFRAEWKTEPRPARDRQVEEIHEALAGCEALVIAGGHVSSLLNRMRLFDVIQAARHLPIVAWSAGAMILTERVVLFHDHPPYGKDIAQVLDVGYGLARGVVALPDPRRRVRVEDAAGIARFARRMSPSHCMALDHGSELRFQGGGEGAFQAHDAEPFAGRAWHLETSGHVHREWSR